MKEFDKWYMKSDVYKHNLSAPVAARKAWKAALKWIEQERKDSRNGFGLTMNDTIVKEIGE